MTIRYKLGKGGERPLEQTVEADTFSAGREVTDPYILADWAVLYRELQEPGFKGATIGLQRAVFGTAVTILGIKR